MLILIARAEQGKQWVSSCPPQRHRKKTKWYIWKCNWCFRKECWFYAPQRNRENRECRAARHSATEKIKWYKYLKMDVGIKNRSLSGATANRENTSISSPATAPQKKSGGLFENGINASKKNVNCNRQSWTGKKVSVVLPATAPQRKSSDFFFLKIKVGFRTRKAFRCHSGTGKLLIIILPATAPQKKIKWSIWKWKVMLQKRM